MSGECRVRGKNESFKLQTSSFGETASDKLLLRGASPWPHLGGSGEWHSFISAIKMDVE